jgi:hypothetical protein
MSQLTPEPSQQPLMDRLNRGVIIWGVVITVFVLAAAVYSIVSQLRAGEKIKPVPFSAPSASASHS